jgi:phosphate transport system substrate-binding protein
MLKFLKVAAVATTLFVANFASAETSLKGSGATFPNPIYQRWIGEYIKANPGTKIDYASVGSGTGIKDITAKTVDFAGSDAPLSKKEKAGITGDVVHVPTVAGAVVLIYNLPGYSGEVNLTGEAVAKIYMGEIKAWNDPAIAGLNAGAALPALPITPVWRTDGSGTSFVFTNYLSTQSEAFTTKVGPGKQPRFLAGVGGKGSEGVTSFVRSQPGAIGYVEHNYATENKITYAAIKNAAGKFVKATPESAAAAGAAAVAKMKSPDGLAVDIWNQAGEGAYPISAFTYLLVYKDLSYLGSEAKAKELTKFWGWCLSEAGQKIAAEMSYAPLAPAVQAKAAEALKSLTFSGKQVASK